MNDQRYVFPKSILRCPDCRYWEMTPTDLSQGACRRYPPKVFIHATNRGPAVMSAQPVTGRDVGCAEGEPKLVQ